MQEFTFQANARPIQQRQRFRDDPGQTQPCLITVDPRVCRGSTYVKKQKPVESFDPITTKKKTYKPKTREIAPQSLEIPQQREDRIDMILQTEPYLQEIVDKVEKKDIVSQTDAFLDRPPTPPFIPPKNGVDVSCQVEESEVFDLEFELQPIVSIIVSKTLEQSLMEVLDEEELRMIQKHKEAIEHQRNVELADIQRLEEAEKRKFQEKENRLAEKKRVEDAQNELKGKIAARGFSEFFVSELLYSAIDVLEKHNFFYDEVEREIETEFLPFLKESMTDLTSHKKLQSQIEKTVIFNLASDIDDQRDASRATTDERLRSDKKIQANLFRQMFIEDITAMKIRRALESQKKKDVKQTEEEDEE